MKATKKSRAVVKKAAPPAVVVPKLPTETLEKIVLKGDLSNLSTQETMDYYLKFCGHLGLDPVTRPFDLLVLNGKKVLYAHKGATDQLRKKYGVSVTDLRGELLGDCYRVTAIGRDHTGRTDASTGVVKVKGLQGDSFANAVMKAETKAKRRLTLSLCGLGMLDETEVETIPGAMTVNLSTGETPTDTEPVYDVGPKEEAKPPVPEEQIIKATRLGVARSDLNDIFKKLKASKLFTDAEIDEKSAEAVAAKDNTDSLLDLGVAWVDEMNARKRGEQ